MIRRHFVQNIGKVKGRLAALIPAGVYNGVRSFLFVQKTGGSLPDCGKLPPILRGLDKTQIFFQKGLERGRDRVGLQQFVRLSGQQPV